MQFRQCHGGLLTAPSALPVHAKSTRQQQIFREFQLEERADAAPQTAKILTEQNASSSRSIIQYILIMEYLHILVSIMLIFHNEYVYCY